MPRWEMRVHAGINAESKADAEELMDAFLDHAREAQEEGSNFNLSLSIDEMGAEEVDE